MLFILCNDLNTDRDQSFCTITKNRHGICFFFTLKRTFRKMSLCYLMAKNRTPLNEKTIPKTQINTTKYDRKRNWKIRQQSDSVWYTSCRCKRSVQSDSDRWSNAVTLPLAVRADADELVPIHTYLKCGKRRKKHLYTHACMRSKRKKKQQFFVFGWAFEVRFSAVMFWSNRRNIYNVPVKQGLLEAIYRVDGAGAARWDHFNISSRGSSTSTCGDDNKYLLGNE